MLRRLLLHVLQERGLPADPENIRSRRCVQAYIVEDELDDIRQLLDQQDEVTRRQVWQEALDTTEGRISQASPEHVFVGTHMTLCRGHLLVSPVSFERLAAMDPDVVVTLIDDMHDIWSKINAREGRAKTGSYLLLREIAAWRSAEIMMANAFVEFANLRNPGTPCRHYVVAVKHRPSMLYRLLFKPDVLRVYASYPITSTRDDSERRAEINAFRNALAERFTVFDPLSIDERAAVAATEEVSAETGEKQKVITCEGNGCRWPIDDAETLSGVERDIYPLLIPSAEVREVQNDIDAQIRSRDFCLIRQSQCIAAYKPIYRDVRSMGVIQELTYAANSAQIPRYVVQPNEEGTLSHSPFEDYGAVVDTTEELVEQLTRFQADLSEKRGSE